MCKKKSLLYFASFQIFFWGFYITCLSQDTANTIGRVSISSPTAASLGKYGDIPVSYHTGVPDISIPINKISSGSLSLPISVSYHASGLKVQEQASWVGAGWSLNAGGVITRTVRGGADDRGYQSYQGYFNACTKGHYSDYGYTSYSVSGTDTNQYESQLGITDSYFLHGYSDGEPDLFFFNFGGYSGKFYFNDDRTPVIVPQQDINIQTDYQAGPGFNGFIVTTPNGVKYYFGRTGNYSSPADPVESTISSTIDNGPSYASAAASSWFLNKIISTDGLDSITLQYQSEKYSYYTWSMFPAKDVNEYGALAYEKNGVNLVKNIINGVRLSKISFPFGNVIFTPSSVARKDLSDKNWATMADVTSDSSFSLGSVQITDNNGFCKKDSFYYSYFKCTTAGLQSTFWESSLDILNLHSDTSLLRLDSIQEITCDQSIKIPPYKFSYFTETLPRRLNFGIDHWGFYNGVTNNVGLIPTYTVRYTVDYYVTTKNGANRDASWPAMRAGTLQKIYYPTGGYSVFDYEPHNTHVNYYTYTDSARWWPSVGYDGHNGYLGDGGDNPIKQTFHFTTNGYQIIVSNTNNGISGSTAVLTVEDGAHNYVFNTGPINPGITDTFNIKLDSGGTYTVYFHKEYATTGYGASAQFNEWVPMAVSGNITVGGLRIKTITSKDSVTPKDIVTRYSYNYANNDSTGNSSGILYSRPVYVQWLRNKIWDLVYGKHLLCNVHQTYYRSPCTTRPMETTQGNHIGYNEVYVSQTGNGYNVFRYYGSNVWDYNLNDVCIRNLDEATVCDDDVPFVPAEPAPFEYMRGELKYQGSYNQNGQILSDAWHFPLYVQDSITTLGHISARLPNNVYTFSEYSLQSARKVRDSIVATSYDPATSNFLTDINATYYGSLFHRQPTRKISINSTGNIATAKIQYAFDFRPSNFNTPDSFSYYLTAVHNDSVTMFNRFNGCPSNESYLPLLNSCHKAAFVQFHASFALDRMKYIAYRRRTFTDPGNVYATAHASAKSSAGTELKPIFELQDEYQNPVIEATQWKDTSLLQASFIRYDSVTNSSGKAYPNKTQLINLSSPSGSFTNAVVSGNTITKDSRYKDEDSYIFSAGNPIQTTGHSGVTSSYIWDYSNTEPIAKISGAANDQVAYTSFESDGKGNWSFTGTVGVDYTTPTGKKIYTLTGSNNITKSGLNSGKTYIISYWAKSSSALSITGTISDYPIAGRTFGVWKYFEHHITGQTSVTITGSVAIDELRLYPPTAQMITYTYDPLIGMSSQCDANNRISYYEYDALGRLVLIRDQDKNIIKSICYNYAGQTENCHINTMYFNSGISQNFTRNNCSSGQIGTSVTYTVPQGKYTSTVNQYSADLLAQEDMSANGQTYANTNGSCLCDTTVCTGSDPSYKCINGACEKGTLVCVSSVFSSQTHLWTCTYRYRFSDCSENFAYTTQNFSSCTLDRPC